jgi:hypothetical protein
MASGMPTDAVLFASGAAPGADKGTGKAAAALKDQLRKLSGPQSMDAAGLQSLHLPTWGQSVVHYILQPACLGSCVGVSRERA